MHQTPRFHLDECLSVGIAKGLRLRDRDCTTPKDVDLIASTDAQQWDFAKRNGRIIITADQDFLRMAAIDNDHAGIIYWTKSTDGHFGPLVKNIDELCFNLSAADFLGRIHFL